MGKYFFRILFITVIVLIVFCSIQAWVYYHPELDIHVSRVSKGDDYMEIAVIAYNETSIFGTNAKFNEYISGLSRENNGIITKLHEGMNFPGQIECSVVETDSGAVIIYTGFMTDLSGDLVEIDESITVDYAVSEIVYEDLER